MCSLKTDLPSPRSGLQFCFPGVTAQPTFSGILAESVCARAGVTRTRASLYSRSGRGASCVHCLASHSLHLPVYFGSCPSRSFRGGTVMYAGCSIHLCNSSLTAGHLAALTNEPLQVLLGTGVNGLGASICLVRGDLHLHFHRH